MRTASLALRQASARQHVPTNIAIGEKGSLIARGGEARHPS